MLLRSAAWDQVVLNISSQLEQTTLPDLDAPTLHKAQAAIVEEATRFNVLCCGRRLGKTVLGLDRAYGPALEGHPVGWFTPTYKLMLEPWQEARRTLSPITARSNATERRIELSTGGVIEFWSLDDVEAGRGRKYKRVIIDEAAMARRLEEAWTHAIRPTLTDLEGDAWFLSTPKGKDYFWRLFQMGLDPGRPDWRSWQLPTVANPMMNPAEVEAARGQLPEEVFRQEYLAAFIDDTGGVFRRVMDAATATERDRAEDGRTYVIGVDWAKQRDFTVLTVLDEEAGAVVHVDRFNQIDYSVQVGRLEALCERFSPRSIVAERNSIGEPLLEQMKARGLPVTGFTTTAQSKGRIIDALALAFEKGAITIPADPVLIGELQAYERERLPGGTFRYNAPAGLHDDCVISLALAWEATSTNNWTVVWA